MNIKSLLLLLILAPIELVAQDLSQGLLVNDLSPHLMEDIAKPAYLETIVDPSFGTTIRRISNAATGEVIVPMYSTVQAWNADETLMILYNQSTGTHVLLEGMSYEFIRVLTDIVPADLEQIFWDFNDPDLLYYLEADTDDLIRYSVASQAKETIVNLQDLSSCDGDVLMGNDIQMMSWDSDVFTFRCENELAYSYRISTEELTTFDLVLVNNASPGVAPSSDRYYHRAQVYDSSGSPVIDLNVSAVEHSCIGQLSGGQDAYFAISFAEGPQGGCLGDIIAHDLETGDCFPLISQDQGYNYSQSGTHISALAHKNTEGGWIAASMMGYDQDGQSLLDQELVIAKAEAGNIKVCRIGHHRSDEDQFDYWGEPHAVISPTGTRVLFASDWSGAEDGQSVDSYVVELPSFSTLISTDDLAPLHHGCQVSPNPVTQLARISFDNPSSERMIIAVYSSSGKVIMQDNTTVDHCTLPVGRLDSGLYFFRITDELGASLVGTFIKK